MGQVTWEADKMLDVYIYDYLVKRNLQETAKAFMAEGKVATDPVAIDAPGGFLFEWWSVFWDIFIARTNEKHSDVAATYIEMQQQKAAKDHSKMQQYQLMQRQASLQRRDANHPALGGAGDGNSDGILGSSVPSSMAAKAYGEQLKNSNSIDSEALKAPATHPGLLVQGQPGNISSALQQIQGQNQIADVKPGFGVPQRSLPMDPSSLYGQRPVQGKPGLGAGLNQGASNPATLNGWPLSKIQSEQVRSSLGPQVPRPFMSSSNQFPVLPPQLQHAQMQGNIGHSHGYGILDPQRIRALQRGGLNAKDGQPTGSDGQAGPPSPMVRQEQLEYLMKMAQMQQPSAQKPQEQLQHQNHLQQIIRKRKPTSSGAANSSGTGNTVGPSNSQPSTPSTSTPGDGVAVGSNLPHASTMPKSSMMYGTDGAGGLGSSTNQMDDLENFGDIGTLDEHVESFLSNGEDARDVFAPTKNSPAEHNTETSKAITEIACNRTSSNKVSCCHFSSDGKLLASAGHDKKVFIWNMGTLLTASTPEEHMGVITDIRFRPDSTQLATSSFDRTVRLWNAAEPICLMHTFPGHSSQVTSLDFHPKKTDILCSCDDFEIRLWNVSQYSSSSYSKGSSRLVRFQPRIGQLLAAGADNVVSIFDFEAKRRIHALQGHNKEVQSVCWDPNGEFLATVSHDTVKVWSLASGECTHELNSSGNNYHSCLFHPTYPGLLVIGGYQQLELWDRMENKTMSIRAHDGLVSALALTATGTFASASHDRTVKLWK
ncbi:transcriptional corepressor LEUNIG_HOMOLOG-like isoform X2 [Asparagus officinalis]|uniref:transcriptional corepressor LEUNIG_HOMOLOG-like isoform X2 n=1 Tax=Asparagus officinalis TaxID=4686 RepID=UPI00098DE445|nr:transcriptional corepressor LEUNIG_HOMOLOG-like isoform X2 [Asparagus officinalis]